MSDLVHDTRLTTPFAGIGLSDLMDAEACNQLHAHAVETYPHECVGYISKKGEYVRLENIAASPEQGAQIAPDTRLKLLDEGVMAFCHSHPDGPDCPSATDMLSQQEMAVPWVIVSTNGSGCLAPFVLSETAARPPLLGRGFRHGINDCFGLIRDFYEAIMGVALADCPRDWEWWSASNIHLGEGLYEDNFAKWGFREVTDDLKVGDVFLLRAGSRVPNHAGIYIGDHLLLHHLSGRMAADPTRLSTIEPMIRWRQNDRMVKTVRYRGKKGGR